MPALLLLRHSHVRSEMQEVGDELADGLLVVDECLEQFGGAARGDEVIVGKDCRDEAGHAFGEKEVGLCGSYPYMAVALQVHDDDEGPVLDHVAVEGACGLDDLDAEVGGVEYLLRHIGIVAMLCLVFGVDGIVDGLGCKLGMELAGLAIKAGTVVVVDAVGDIGRLLYLSQTYTSTDGMDSSGWKIEHITIVYLMLGEDLADSAVGYSLLVFLRCYLQLEAGIEIGARFCIEDVPHLGFAELVVLTLCHLVIRMHLMERSLWASMIFVRSGSWLLYFFATCFPRISSGRRLITSVRL